MSDPLDVDIILLYNNGYHKVNNGNRCLKPQWEVGHVTGVWTASLTLVVWLNQESVKVIIFSAGK